MLQQLFFEYGPFVIFIPFLFLSGIINYIPEL